MVERKDMSRLQRILLERGGLTPTALAELEKRASLDGTSLEELLVKEGILGWEQLYEMKSEALGIPYVDLEHYLPDPKVLQSLPEDAARRLKVLPLFQVGDTLTIATATPEDVAALDEVHRLTGRAVNYALASPPAIATALDRLYSSDTVRGIDEAVSVLQADEELSSVVDSESTSRSLQELAGEAPVVRFVNSLIEHALRERASDIHVEPEQDDMLIRVRVDGTLREAGRFPVHLHPLVTSRIKILANMDIAEKRLPQDGQFGFTSGERQVDVRVSSFPTVYGENMVLRLLDRRRELLRMNELGMTDDVARTFLEIIHRPHGMILVTGPTGSGKTTTLYSALSELNTIERNIITLEDPVEYRLPLVRQSQINQRAGLTFASGLRSILRQDPDIIMVGEIRDTETAEVAFQAALTGHLVFSTLHTNDAAGALTRLLDMNVEPFLVASSVIAIVAQRLVRRICDRCREPHTPEPAVAERLGLNPGSDSWRGTGCISCGKSGYHGRVGVYELLVATPEVRDFVMRRRSADEIKKTAVRQGMRTLREDAVLKLLNGLTTAEEALRVTADS
ncbi:MAG: GspE/PulE family protein [candidate division WOR-3 bacterium]